MFRYLTPLVLFITLVAFFIFGLQNDPYKLPSPLIGQPAPEFELPALHNTAKSINTADLKGEIALINVWASWCSACLIEHPILIKAVANQQLKLYGLNYKDKREDALKWLNQFGDPYIESVFDEFGKVGIDYGVYGVPETFVLDKNGIIRYKHIGPINQEQLDTIILPLIKKLENA